MRSCAVAKKRLARIVQDGVFFDPKLYFCTARGRKNAKHENLIGTAKAVPIKHFHIIRLCRLFYLHYLLFVRSCAVAKKRLARIVRDGVFFDPKLYICTARGRKNAKHENLIGTAKAVPIKHFHIIRLYRLFYLHYLLFVRSCAVIANL